MFNRGCIYVSWLSTVCTTNLSCIMLDFGPVF